MNRLPFAACLLVYFFHCTVPVYAQADGNAVSLRLEIQRAIDRGVKWLQTQQKSETGCFGDPDYPALTALAVSAMMGDPSREAHSWDQLPSQLRRAYEFIASTEKEDGGLYGKGLACYNTSLCTMALLNEESGHFNDNILKARSFLISLQSDTGEKGKADEPFDGGVGYGGSSTLPDLSNTHFALEALYYSKELFADTSLDTSTQPHLNWEAAIKFVERCQNLSATNDQPWASDDPDNRGGFLYSPKESKAGEQKIGEGDGAHVALRSSGGISYAGLLSFIYAEVDLKDQRVQAVLEWLNKNFTVEENPGLGQQGLFYYFHTMAKALTLAKVESLQLADGSKVDWREELAKKLFDMQDSTGSWVNSTGRWWEKEPELVTSFALLTLEHIHRSLSGEL
ncbi:MAG: cycloartenol synthase [Verrucomicrobiae bacterium]|nr:cycloartenol synthase [Verrucomicrobiae bacterium]